MTDVNTLNERTRTQHIGDRLAALLIAVYKLPLEQRTDVLAAYEKNLQNIAAGRQTQDISHELTQACPTCDGDGVIEIMGDGANFEWDVIAYKPCPYCL